ncbi:DUF4198 domain-containing protein [Tenacibaculum sp. IB213877]|uniref:DUF4198 domain-containing protein n=1 Tax=Tenacibaculum sp. IB213877 TaxID=3097351 RepID=UPI002A5A04AB|nr:DUF4198 domain-containing protein [Tenacibaculum sp. IB213877]MDY0779980.1 DUF4198 domain-containing protein [Tenacibaculum sp. IB213877]
MKTSILTFLLVLFASIQSFAHYLWIETKTTGKLNKEQEVRVYFGEYTYGVIEKANEEAFGKVKNFTLWIVDPSGKKTQLNTKAFDNYFSAKFTPKTKGTYTVVLNNNEIDVIDYTQYDFGIFKTHYHSTAKIIVGNKNENTATLNDTGIVIKEIATSTEEKKLQVLYKNKPLVKNEVKVFVTDLWSKTLHTDKDGFVSFKLPWKTKYTIETTTKEEVPGKYNGKDYQFIWHCATYCFPDN